MLNRYLREIARWIGIRMTEPTTIYEDNQACLDVINAGQITQRTRHMAVAVGICQEDVKRGLAKGSKVLGTLNMSDNGTKPNPNSTHHFQVRFGRGERFYPVPNSLHGELMQVAMVNYCYSNETQGDKMINISDLAGLGEIYDTKDVSSEANKKSD